MSEQLPDKEPGVNPLTGRKASIQNLRPNRNGRPKGALGKKATALDRTRKDPALELITIAQLLRTNPPESQRKALESEMKIWMELLEYQKAKKKPLMTDDKKEPKQVVLQATNLLEELENEHADTGSKGTSNKASLDSGPTDLQAEAGSEEDLSDSQE